MTAFGSFGGLRRAAPKQAPEKKKPEEGQDPQQLLKDAKQALRDQADTIKIAADTADRKLQNTQNKLAVKAAAMRMAQQAQQQQTTNELQQLELNTARSDAQLADVKNRAQEIAIAQEVENTYGVPAEEFIGPPRAEPLLSDQFQIPGLIEALQAQGITPTSEAIEAETQKLVGRATTDPQRNLASDILGLPLDLLSGVFGAVGIDIPTGVEAFGSDPDVDTITRRLAGLQGISVQGAAAGNQLAATVGSTVIGGQVDLAQTIAGIESQRIGLEQSRIGTEAQLEAQRAGLDLETQIDLERLDLQRRGLDIEKERFDETIGLQREQFKQRKTEFNQVQRLRLDQFELDKDTLDQRRLEAIGRGQDMPASMLQQETNIQTAISGILGGVRVDRALSGPLLNTLGRTLSEEQISSLPVEQQDVARINNDAIRAEAIQTTIEENPGATLEDIQNALTEEVTAQIQAARKTAIESGTFQDFAVSEAHTRVAAQLQGLANVTEGAITERKGDELFAVTDDISVRRRLLQMDKEQVRRTAGYGRRLVSIREMMRTAATFLGLTGPVLSAERQEFFESRLGSDEGRRPIDAAAEFIRSESQNIFNLANADPRTKEAMRERLARGLSFLGFHGNIFEIKK